MSRHLDMIPLASGDAGFVETWARICREGHNTELEWIAKLRAVGVKGSHPDDGWVNREQNYVSFVYPQFNDGPQVGDMIALGWSGKTNKTRICRVTKVVHGSIHWEATKYWFEEVSNASS